MITVKIGTLLDLNAINIFAALISVNCHNCCAHSDGTDANLPLICLVPRGAARPPPAPAPSRSTVDSEFTPLSEEYLRKNFKFPQRALYLDPFNRPLITFPMTQEKTKHINQYRKSKINQGILDGVIHPSKAIWVPSVFVPYLETGKAQSERGEDDDDQEIIYLLQLPDYETSCPVHNQAVKIPRFILFNNVRTICSYRFTTVLLPGDALRGVHRSAHARHEVNDLILLMSDNSPDHSDIGARKMLANCGKINNARKFIWHSHKKSEKQKPPPEVEGSGYIVGGMLNKPKPWLLSRLTDFDLYSQW
ncbi:hypothetical protein EVAR_71882_1 [Eumeta japonica]|uniref:Uncharacterized protein n=1 Tax=Eumeta variegata TaxID=151549 RepID=A0A4C1SPH8_EUMVA|nr:hypothetical protein EVAR_71882_1 [Eumeta japonica]